MTGYKNLGHKQASKAGSGEYYSTRAEFAPASEWGKSGLRQHVGPHLKIGPEEEGGAGKTFGGSVMRNISGPREHLEKFVRKHHEETNTPEEINEMVRSIKPVK